MLSLYYNGKRVNLRRLPVGTHFRLEKAKTFLGEKFAPTDLGNSEGSIAQFRGPYASHVREYPTHFTIHRDRVDPRRDPLGHLIKDAPDDLTGIGIGLGSAIVVGVAVYESRKDKSEHALLEGLLAGTAAGAIGFIVGKALAK